MQDELQHYGTPRHSGRYPWGSGGDPYQRNSDFLGYVEKLHNNGLSEIEIAAGMGISTTELRIKKTIAKSAKRAEDSAQALRLKDKGMSNTAIGKRMGLNESSVRALLDPVLKERGEIIRNTANVLKDAVDNKKYIDVGLGVENHLGISRTKLDTAIASLEDQGYKLFYIQTTQLGTGKKTSIKILAKENAPRSEIYNDINKNREQIKLISDFAHTSDMGRTYRQIDPPQYINSNRVQIKYKEQGGSNMDGVIQLRRGVEDLDLGASRYAQVRIGVDGTHYLKGMAMYSDKMPYGADIIYNTSKKIGTPKEKVFKEIETDPDNPFGSIIKPGGQKGALNIVNEEGSWEPWSRSLSSQILSKQSHSLAKKQLDMAEDIEREKFNDINRLTNPTVKKRLLESFADTADSAAVELKAAALPRQSQHVILPLTTIKPNEIYAPNFDNGERVVLIRHPHGGTFEIPELTVNNKSPEGKSLISRARDAVGIHPTVASKLSGADFDGDTVIVIPNKHRDITTSPTLASLKNFDPREAYPQYEGMKVMSPHNKQLEMGKVSNLITDMTIKGATHEEIARAIKHSMVVIDAEKHKLDYQRSFIDNGISELKDKYQKNPNRPGTGASTIVSLAGSEVRVPQREERFHIDSQGRKVFTDTGATYVVTKTSKRTGQTITRVLPKVQKSTRMAETEDAASLSSGTKMEELYVKYANNMKALANQARKTMVETPNLVYSPTAKKTYAGEVSSLISKLSLAYRNKPLERQAQLLANKTYAAKKAANPNLDPDDLKKLRGQELERARAKTGAHKALVEITDREWEAIQHGAITHNVLTKILLNTDMENLKQRAMPRTYRKATPAKVTRAKNLYELGYTQAEIANVLGLSVSTIKEILP